MTDWELVNPEGAARPVSLRPAARPASLDRKTVGLAWNGKPGGDEALLELGGLLTSAFPDVRLIHYWEEVPTSVAQRELALHTLEAMAARKPDVVIVSQAD